MKFTVDRLYLAQLLKRSVAEYFNLPPDDMKTKLSDSACPVPFEQQPLNEYLELQESDFFQWAMLDWQPYLRKIIWTWVWGWAIAGPVAAASFAPAKFPLQFGLIGAAGATFLLALVLVRLYLGWRYVCDRLFSTDVFYEESGWYDGQVWSKPSQVLIQERLVVTYEIKPAMQRLERTFGVLAVGLLLGAVIWTVLR